MNLRRRIMSPSLAALRPQCTPRQTFQTGYGGRIRTYVNEFQKLAPFQLGHSVKFFDLVDLARFERATSTFARSRSDSAELQVRMNWYGHPAELRSATRLFWNRNYPLQGYRTGLRHWRRRQELNLHAHCAAIYSRQIGTAIPLGDASGKLARPLPQAVLTFWRKGQDLNLQATSAVVFKTTALPVRLPFQNIYDCQLPISDCLFRGGSG